MTMATLTQQLPPPQHSGHGGTGVIQYGCRDDDDSDDESGEEHRRRGLFGGGKKKRQNGGDDSDDDGSVCSKASVASRASQAMKNLGGKLFGKKDKGKDERDNGPPLALSGMMIGGESDHDGSDISDQEDDPLDEATSEYFRSPPPALRQELGQRKQHSKHKENDKGDDDDDDSDDESVLASVGRGLRKAGGKLKKTLGKAASGQKQNDSPYNSVLGNDHDDDASDLSSDPEGDVLMGAMDRSSDDDQEDDEEEEEQAKMHQPKQKRASKLRIPIPGQTRKATIRSQSDHGDRRPGGGSRDIQERRHSDHKPRKSSGGAAATHEKPTRRKSFDEKAPPSDRLRGGRRPSRASPRSSREGGKEQRRHNHKVTSSSSSGIRSEHEHQTRRPSEASKSHQTRWQMAQMSGKAAMASLVQAEERHLGGTIPTTGNAVADPKRAGKLGQFKAITEKNRSSRSGGKSPEEPPVWAMNVTEQMLFEAKQ